MSIKPHGGNLVNRILQGEAREEALKKVEALPRLVLDNWEISDLELIANGAFSPLTGFMKQGDYLSVLQNMCLQKGLLWSIPIVLGVTPQEAERLKIEGEAGLFSKEGRPLGILHVEEIYEDDKILEAEKVYQTKDENHPGVARVYRRAPLLVGGPISLLNRKIPDVFSALYLDPEETRQVFSERGWKRIVAFQTRNPIHRAHEYLQKCALEICDGLFLNPLMGETKEDDIPAHVRVKCYNVLLDYYYPAERAFMSAFPAAMRYAGPREAVFHAIVRKNYGATHFIVGRDHAGVGNYYGTYDAQRIFDEIDPGELEITPLFFEHTFYCKVCRGMASSKTCPHVSEDHVFLSGTKVRAMLSEGEIPPEEFTRREVARILIDYYEKKNKES